MQWLEEKGISHRDLKPDNIGVSTSGSDKSLALVVFDFSLADTPAENIRAGTPRYLDPFLGLRQPPRWDVYAERFAAAMTLHEMATGSLPVWGDGQSDPALIENEISLDSECFDPSVRQAPSTFFVKALARDYRARFDSAEKMRFAWLRCFEAIDLPAAGGESDHELPHELAAVTPDTPLHSLGLSPRLSNALDRLGAHTAAQLVALPRIRLYRNKGIGQRIVKRIRELSERLAEHLAEQGRTLDTTITTHDEVHRLDPAAWSIDLLASKLISSHLPEPEAHLVGGVLGLPDGTSALAGLPGLSAARHEVAATFGVTPADIADALGRARERWGRQPWMAPLRDTVAALVEKHGGVMTMEELADALAAARGSTEAGEMRRPKAVAVAAAALEVEWMRQDSRFRLYRHDRVTLILATEALDPGLTASPEARAAWVRTLGQRADMLTDADSLASPARVLEELAAVTSPADIGRLDPNRILHLAVRVATRAALSSRGELYPRGMAAARAAKLGAASLLGPTKLTESQIRKRIESRYPEAEPLPTRPALDVLLEEAGLKLGWEAQDQAYHSLPRRPTHLASTSTNEMFAADGDGGLDDAGALNDRLKRVVVARGFLALSVGPRHLLNAEQHLATEAGLTPFSLEAGLIRHMRAVAGEVGADWRVVVAADAAPEGSTNRRRLGQLVRRAAPRLLREIEQAAEPLLLTRPGLLARYRQIDVLAGIQDACQRGVAPAARVLCIAADAAVHLPVIDGQPLPVVFAAAWARPGREWLVRIGSSAHRPGAVKPNGTQVDGGARQTASSRSMA